MVPIDVLIDPLMRAALEWNEKYKWDLRFLALAEHIAQWSKDPRTKVGAVIVDDLNRIVSVGYNGFPRGVTDSPELYDAREMKLLRVVHAETNAILNANKSVSGCKLYLTLPPCHECAKVIIQSGITQVIYRESDRVDEVSAEMFNQVGIIPMVFPNESSSSL